MISLSWLPVPISIFIKYHLSDILWALSFAETVHILKRKYYLSFFIVLAAIALLNILQHFGIAKGTCDVLDVLFTAGSLVIYIVIRKGIEKNEKKT